MVYRANMHIDTALWDLLAKKLAGELSSGQELRLRNWLDAHPDNQKFFAQMAEAWNQAAPAKDLTGPDADVSLIWLKLEERLDRLDQGVVMLPLVANEKKNGFFNLKAHFLIAASAITVTILLISAVYFFSGSAESLASIDLAPDDALIIKLPKKTREIRLSSDSSQLFILPDHTRIWLNEKSSLSYELTFGDSIRKVVLQGEAFFEVASDANIPFVILANGSETNVIGTSFNLKAYAQEPAAVTVVSGKVAFTSAEVGKEKIILTKGEQGIFYNKEQKLVKQKWDDPHFLDWKHLLVYKQEISKPANYLKNQSSWKKSVINQTEIRGEIGNIATLATYKNVKLRVTYFKKKKRKSYIFTVYKSLVPGQKVTYKYRLADWFGKTNNLKIEVVDASVSRD